MSKNAPIAVQPQFSVVYEDEEVLVVDKAAPLIMHPTGGGSEPTLLDGIRELLAYELTCGGCVSLVNRLDRETSGLVLIAKTARAAHELGCAMQNRLIHKRYAAIVRGHPMWDLACCAEPILRMEDVATTRIHIRQTCHPTGRPCRTDFRVLRRTPAHGTLPPLSLLECNPVTGRMHQIRVHLSFLGFPILGDKIYGGDESCYLEFMHCGWTPALARKLIIPRHALHATELTFPLFGRSIHVRSLLPPDLSSLLPDSESPMTPGSKHTCPKKKHPQ